MRLALTAISGIPANRENGYAGPQPLASRHTPERMRSENRAVWRDLWCEERLLSHFAHYKPSFYQDRLGTNIGKTLKKEAFSAGVVASC